MGFGVPNNQDQTMLHILSLFVLPFLVSTAEAKGAFFLYFCFGEGCTGFDYALSCLSILFTMCCLLSALAKIENKLEKKHFCGHCSDQNKAKTYSDDRNTYCDKNNCWQTNRNTVFEVDLATISLVRKAKDQIFGPARVRTWYCDQIRTL